MDTGDREQLEIVIVELAGYAGVKLAAATTLDDMEIRKVQYAGRVG